jgi:hypothetical protein
MLNILGKNIVFQLIPFPPAPFVAVVPDAVRSSLGVRESEIASQRWMLPALVSAAASSARCFHTRTISRACGLELGQLGYCVSPWPLVKIAMSGRAFLDNLGCLTLQFFGFELAEAQNFLKIVATVSVPDEFIIKLDTVRNKLSRLIDDLKD